MWICVIRHGVSNKVRGPGTPLAVALAYPVWDQPLWVLDVSQPARARPLTVHSLADVIAVR